MRQQFLNPAGLVRGQPGEYILADDTGIGKGRQLAAMATWANSRKKTRIQYRDVPIAELADLPEEARDRYAEGLKELEVKIDAVPDIPVLCFDFIAQRLRSEGYSVGEISGRKKRLEWDEQNTGWRLLPRAKSKKAVKGTIRAFNNGGLQAVIINRSAATGVSMHSSPRFLDQSRRRLIEHQIPENPVDRIQLLGRVNRFDQLSSPLITTASTGIYGEVRYLMMQNKKLARMSANVRSSRDNAMSLKSVRDLFNVVGKEAVEEFLADNALVAKRLGLSAFDIENAADLVNKVTMRIPLLKVTQQEVVYNDLYSRVDEILFRAELEGHNPLKPGEMDLRAKTESESVFFGEEVLDDPSASAFDAPVIARRIEWSRDLNPMSFAALKAVCDVNVDRLVDEAVVVSGQQASQPQAPDQVEAGQTGEAELDVDQEEDGAQTRQGRAQGQIPSALQDPALIPASNFQGPKLSSDLVSRVVEGYKGLARLSHMASEVETFEAAVLGHVQTRRAYVKWKWLERNLPLLAPGARLMDSRPADEEAQGSLVAMLSHRTGAVVVDVRPPAQADQLLDLGKWNLALVAPGDERPRTFTLRSIVSKVTGTVSKGEITGDLNCTFDGQFLTGGIYHPGTRGRVEVSFEFVNRGKQSMSGLVLLGNVYLAAEWAAATGVGQPIIYTDDAGQRHRAIGIPRDVGNTDPEHLPVRVADPDAAQRFLLPLMMHTTEAAQAEEGNARDETEVQQLPSAPSLQRGGVYVLDTTFKSAMASLQGGGGRTSVIVIDPRKMLAVTCAAEDVRRIRAALTAGQKALRSKEVGPDAKAKDDPAHVSISVAKTAADFGQLPDGIRYATAGLRSLGGSADWLGAGAASMRKTAVVTMKFTTELQARRAIDVLRAHSGLEIYASSQDLRQAAKNALREAASARREQVRARQAEAARHLQQASEVGRGQPEIPVQTTPSGAHCVQADDEEVPSTNDRAEDLQMTNASGLYSV